MALPQPPLLLPPPPPRRRAVRLVNRLCPRILFRLLFLVLLSTWVCPHLSRQFPHVTGLVSSLLFSFARLYFLLTMALSIISLNVYGLRDQDKRSGLRQWISSLPLTVDIVCLQEAHVVSQAEASLCFSSAGFTVASSPGTNRSCGVIVLARPSCLMVNSWPDQDGRFLMCEFSCRGKVFRVATVYAPNRNPDRNDFFILSRPNWMSPYPPFFAVILTAFLIVQLIGVGQYRMTTHGRVSGLSLLFLTRPWLPMSGTISIPRRLPSPGPGGMVLLHPALIL